MSKITSVLFCECGDGYAVVGNYDKGPGCVLANGPNYNLVLAEAKKIAKANNVPLYDICSVRLDEQLAMMKKG